MEIHAGKTDFRIDLIPSGDYIGYRKDQLSLGMKLGFKFICTFIAWSSLGSRGIIDEYQKHVKESLVESGDDGG